MKKAAAIILVLALCLSSCAVFADEPTSLKSKLTDNYSNYGKWYGIYCGSTEFSLEGASITFTGGCAVLENALGVRKVVLPFSTEKSEFILDTTGTDLESFEITARAVKLKDEVIDIVPRDYSDNYYFNPGSWALEITVSVSDSSDPFAPRVTSVTSTMIKSKTNTDFLNTVLSYTAYTLPNGSVVEFTPYFMDMADGSNNGLWSIDDSGKQLVIVFNWNSGSEIKYIFSDYLSDGTIVLKRADDDLKITLTPSGEIGGLKK